MDIECARSTGSVEWEQLGQAFDENQNETQTDLRSSGCKYTAPVLERKSQLK